MFQKVGMSKGVGPHPQAFQYFHDTVKLGDKEHFDKEQIGVKEPFPMTNLLHKDKEHLALRNKFRVAKKFLVTKFDCIKNCPFFSHFM
jgi:hypothetical protein